MTRVDATAFLVIVLVAAVAALISAYAGRWLVLPVVVVELVLGILVGPQVLGWAGVDGFTTFFSDLGLGMLFFFAGYEIDFERIKGTALKLAGIGWARVAGDRARDRGRCCGSTGLLDAPSTRRARCRRPRSAR